MDRVVCISNEYKGTSVLISTYSYLEVNSIYNVYHPYGYCACCMEYNGLIELHYCKRYYKLQFDLNPHMLSKVVDVSFCVIESELFMSIEDHREKQLNKIL